MLCLRFTNTLPLFHLWFDTFCSLKWNKNRITGKNCQNKGILFMSSGKKWLRRLNTISITIKECLFFFNKGQRLGRHFLWSFWKEKQSVNIKDITNTGNFPSANAALISNFVSALQMQFFMMDDAYYLLSGKLATKSISHF